MFYPRLTQRIRRLHERAPARVASRKLERNEWNQRLFTSTVGVLELALLLSLPLTMAQAGETNGPPAKLGAGLRPAPFSPQAAAAEHELTGRKREAAALYEAIARTNSAARKVLSHRLVTIYTETGETNKALAWAGEVMRDNPEPQAYLAAVQAPLGQCKEARDILQQAIAANTNTTRAVTLRWQLAEVYAQEGDGAKASRVLNEAATLAQGTAMESAARRRLIVM